MTDRVRVGVIGTGWWATQFHLPGLLSYDRAEVVALADRDPERLRLAGDAFGIEARFDDHRAMLDAGIVDAAIVVVPHVHHYAVARDVLDAGVSVLVEKPMTLTSADAWDLVRRADESGLHLVVGYTFQFTRHAARAREIVQSGKLGSIRLVTGLFASMVESYFRGQPDDYAGVFNFPVTGPSPTTYGDPAISGGGQGQTQVTHPMGMVHWVTGLRTTEVYAAMANHDLATDLVDAITYRLDNGALGTMAATGGIRPGQEEMEHVIYEGTEGVMMQDLARGRLRITYADGTVEEPPDLEPDEQYPAERPARCLVDLVGGDGVNSAPGAPAAATVGFLEAAYASAASGAPVGVPAATSTR